MAEEKYKDIYKDIIDLPYQKSNRHPHMSLLNRAAQFSPFAALTGHGDNIEEAGRFVEEKIECDEEVKQKLDQSLQKIMSRIEESPVVSITYFEPDTKKQGGRYRTVKERIKKVDTYERRLILEDRSHIYFEQIINLELENE